MYYINIRQKRLKLSLGYLSYYLQILETFGRNIFLYTYNLFMVLEKMLPGKMPPRKVPPGYKPPRKIAPWKIPPHLLLKKVVCKAPSCYGIS